MLKSQLQQILDRNLTIDIRACALILFYCKLVIKHFICEKPFFRKIFSYCKKAVRSRYCLTEGVPFVKMLIWRLIAGFKVQCILFGLNEPFSVAPNSTSILRLAAATFSVDRVYKVDNNYEICGFWATLVTTIVANLKMSLVFDVDSNLGKKFSNGSYDGLIGKLDANVSFFHTFLFRY